MGRDGVRMDICTGKSGLTTAHGLAGQAIGGIIVAIRLKEMKIVWWRNHILVVLFFACRLLTSFFMSILWLWRKIFRFSSSVGDSSLDPEQRRMLARQGENGTSCHESRVEKARRKAEEKRQARLEKEHSEEEERKQREEVARLVEERRRLRDEILEAEKCSKLSVAAKEKDTKEAEKKRQERRKERDRASSKSNSDGEEVDKRTRKETEQKRGLYKSDHLEQERHAPDNLRVPNMERRHGHGLENNVTSNGTKSGGRYLIE
ncbi:hypothetical protein AXX17_AT3G46010 [Arabidopsis thaliana]|uniref:Uncharacterized protein n=1 Tax=Arabidopsis thaliana TaxID=3702 RepID=A0A178VJA1_ARATH|nr:hypothetical protein AXX17_AT3G46010 [Arabidopsis thaliana]